MDSAIYLIALVLHHEDVLRQPLLHLSLYLKEHRSEYYRLLDLVRTEGEWEAWLSFFLEGVQRTADAAEDTALRLLALFRADELRVQQLGRGSANALRVFQQLCIRPLAPVAILADRTSVSYQPPPERWRRCESSASCAKSPGASASGCSPTTDI